MSLASRLYRLQTTELQLRDKRRALKEIAARLNTNPELSAAEEALVSIESRLEAARKNQRKLEWEVEDLNAKIKGLNDKLYGGSVRNPKELVSLQQDVQSITRHLSGKEEKLIEAMDISESIEAEVEAARQKVSTLKAAWEDERPGLQRLKDSTEAEVFQLAETQQDLRDKLGSDKAQHYDLLAKAKGVAVVKVEQGRCKGCNLTVPDGLYQRARAGDMVECASCGRLLYVE